MNQLAWMIADDMFWPDLGFTEPAEVVASDEYLAGLFGVEKDTEAWFLGIRDGVDPENLEGLKISGGPAGDRNVTVGEKILEDLGVDPESMEWVQIEGGSDDRLQALIAGQIDVAVLQPRHLLPLDQEGGEMIYQEYKDAPQEVWVVTRDFWDNNQEAVCAYLEGR